MLVNKSMYPVQAGYSVISKMQDSLGKLQTQLGSGQKAQTLAEMGNDRAVSLATRTRVSKLESFNANINTVNLRLNFLDQAFTAINGLKSEARTAASPTSFGENNLTMVSLQQNSINRLSLLLETLNLNVAGRYLMGGNKTDAAPVATYDRIMNGDGKSDGFLTVAGERKLADQGPDSTDTLGSLGLPRSEIYGYWGNDLVVNSSEFERFGYKITSISGNTNSMQTFGPTSEPLAPTVQVSVQPSVGDQISMTLTRRDGSTQAFTAVAVNGPSDPNATPPQYSIGGNLEETAGNLQNLMGQKLGTLENFTKFVTSNSDVKIIGHQDGMEKVGIKMQALPAAGERLTIGVKGPDGVTRDLVFEAVTGPADPAADPVQYEIGANRKQALGNLQSAIETAMGKLEAPVKTGRLNAEALGTPPTTIRLQEEIPATEFGYRLSSASTTSSKVTVSAVSGPSASVSITFNGIPRSGESITVNLTLPDGTTTPMSLQAVDREPQTGQFRIGANAEETAASFEAALKLKLDDVSKTTLVAASTYAAADDFFSADGVPRRIDLSNGIENAKGWAPTTGFDSRPTIKWYNGEIGTPGDNPRLSATAQVDDSTKVGYGVRANENGLRQMVMTLAAMSIQEYDLSDTTSQGRFSAMVERQVTNFSTDTATNDSSVEQITLQLGVVRATVGTAQARNVQFTGQLETLLGEVEQVRMEETVMQLLAIKTRLEASFQTTATVAGLSLVNYLK
ncbi:flagellar hook-associated protein FlgL [Devosia equisanguinis]|uniref:Flagellar hook-associated protein FlgL n=1 Tax=Devosia equisanguinis TaxID=2490941 RepID=A0A3S4GML0_9HYPH|nr:hypothetical protein [Devosia equisanguinis]VDS06546.1 flagellar hook-associated protein FlgL [Devosia equisanguinis]